MSIGNRPGGLTAMAIINFILCGKTALEACSFVGAVVLMGYMDFPERVGKKGMDQQSIEQFQMWKEAITKGEITLGPVIMVSVLLLVTSVLLLLAGIGFFKLKKTLGWKVAHIYAGISVLAYALQAYILPARLGGGVTLGTLVGFVYPLLTIAVLNSIFRKDFIN